LTHPTFRVKIGPRSTVDRRRSTPIFDMSAESHIQPLDPSRLGDEVAQMLRRAIISGELDNGRHLVESVLSERFQVSRAPIREALRELESEGLVESRKRGVYVKALTPRDVWELYSLRTMLEGAAVELAVARFDENDIAALRTHLEAMASAAATGERVEFAKADMGFHTQLFERIGHRRLLRVWRSLEGVVLDHKHILDAIERRDAEEARRRDEESLRNGQADFERRFSPDLTGTGEPAGGGGAR
jgi:GntR family transcriptional regulator of gluconate operon